MEKLGIKVLHAVLNLKKVVQKCHSVTEDCEAVYCCTNLTSYIWWYKKRNDIFNSHVRCSSQLESNVDKLDTDMKRKMCLDGTYNTNKTSVKNYKTEFSPTTSDNFYNPHFFPS